MKPKVKAIFFDMDATIVEEETLVEISKAVGKEREIDLITRQAMNGELDFQQALRDRVALLKGTSVEVLQKVAEGLKYTPGITEFTKLARDHGVKLFLVSGGFVEIASVVVHKLKLNDFIANQFEIENGKITGNVRGKIIDAEGKKNFVLSTAQLLGISSKEIAAVGDGANDIPMMSVVEYSVGFRPKEILRKHVKFANDSGNHMDMLSFLFH